MKYLKFLTLITQIGLDMVTIILLSSFVGYLLDKLFKIKNGIFLTIFMILGVLSAFYSVYKNLSKIAGIKKAIEDDNKENQNE